MITYLSQYAKSYQTSTEKEKRFERLVGKRFQSQIYPLPFKPYVYSLLLSKGVDLTDETIWSSVVMTWDEFSDTQSPSVFWDNGKVGVCGDLSCEYGSVVRLTKAMNETSTCFVNPYRFVWFSDGSGMLWFREGDRYPWIPFFVGSRSLKTQIMESVKVLRGLCV
jgi:hypothetical protein